MKKIKVWKKLKKEMYKNIKHLLSDLKNKGYILVLGFSIYIILKKTK